MRDEQCIAHLSHMTGRQPICRSDCFIMVCRRVNTQVMMNKCHILITVLVSHNSYGRAFIRKSNLGFTFKTLSNIENGTRNFNIKARTTQTSSRPHNQPNFAKTHLTSFSSFLLDFPVGYFKIHPQQHHELPSYATLAPCPDYSQLLEFPS
jgi:hypothetical protein